MWMASPTESDDYQEKLLQGPSSSSAASNLIDDPESIKTKDAVITILPRKWSNQTVLAVTCLSFALFVAAEIIGAIASGSLSLLGDAAAMSVDVFTYFTNMYAERVKERTGGVIDHRTRIMLEVAIPAFSVSALIGVTAYVTSEAIAVIANPDAEGEDDVNVYFLYAFSVANGLVDLISGYMFYQGGREILYHDGVFVHEDVEKQETSVKTSRKNLNMISALTHVGGDSLRTLSVFIAAVIATASSISTDICDAWAAIFVSCTIIGIVIPLIYEIYKAAKELLN
jgi:Co/Zn/Cd efflux system component